MYLNDFWSKLYRQPENKSFTHFEFSSSFSLIICIWLTPRWKWVRGNLKIIIYAWIHSKWEKKEWIIESISNNSTGILRYCSNIDVGPLIYNFPFRNVTGTLFTLAETRKILRNENEKCLSTVTHFACHMSMTHNFFFFTRAIIPFPLNEKLVREFLTE